MKKTIARILIFFLMFIAASCNEPETIVTNIVHKDGSVSRVIRMTSTDSNPNRRFKDSYLQVPFDSTWAISDTLEIRENNDTVWVKVAEKLFMNSDAINLSYEDDSGPNRNISRRSAFRKKFRWFNTFYRFSEIIEERTSTGYLLSEYLNQEELLYFYSPENALIENFIGPDSLKYKALDDTVSEKIDKWKLGNIVSEWIADFSGLLGDDSKGQISFDALKAREKAWVSLIEKNYDIADSLWSDGTFLKEFIGNENALIYKSVADSALVMATDFLWSDFEKYSVKIVMPGKLTATNGYFSKNGGMIWPVKSDYFLTETYEMWAESKISNIWCWVFTVFFLIFISTVIIIRIKKRG